jgi:hypothetical protein
MANRKRNVRIVFYVTEDEQKLIEQKMRAANTGNREAYLRKMSLDGYIVRLDLSEIQHLVSLLRNSTNNLNQIARRVNETGNIYREDISDLQEHYEQVWCKTEDIMRKLAEI